MANNYLQEFKGLIGKTQSKQIVKLLNKQKNAGQIRNLDEFAQKMESLIRELTTTTIKPTLQRFAAFAEDLTSEEQFNYMLDRVQDDLQTAFIESNHIDEVQDAHESVVRDLILKKLRAAVAELEGRVTIYEFFNADTRGFSKSLFSTFREAKEGRTGRGNIYQVQFVDPRTQKVIPHTQDANIDLVGERLTLGENNRVLYGIQDIHQIFDAEAPQSSKIVEPPGQSIRNLIDNTNGTYWTQSVLLPTQTESAKVKLELNMAAVREINFIQIEPAVPFPIVLESVDYADSTNTIQELVSPEIEFDNPLGLLHSKVATDRLILTFRNENSRPTQFEEKSDSLLYQAQGAPPQGITPRVELVNNDLNQLIPSPTIRDIVGLVPEVRTSFGGFEYVTGFDNIKVGLSDYDNASIYVSAPLEVVAPSRIGLKTIETRPWLDPATQKIAQTTQTYDVSPDQHFLGSIEYWIVKQDLGENDILLRTTRFPILPLGKVRINHERLVLSSKSDTSLELNDKGALAFFTNRTDGNIVVYRNGVTFPYLPSGSLDAEGWFDETTVEDRIPNNSTPMKFRVRIKGGLAGDIFTVSYTPILSTTGAIPEDTTTELLSSGGLQTVDLVGDLSARLLEEQIIILDNVGKSIGALKSRLFLTVILRQNTADTALTPAVEEYLLVAGSTDPTRLEG